MSERFLNWLARKASDYLTWHWERERRFNAQHDPCPDCGEGPLFCYCHEVHERNEMLTAAYRDGYEQAREEFPRWTPPTP